MEPQILVENVSKSYKTYIKGEGIINSLAGFSAENTNLFML